MEDLQPGRFGQQKMSVPKLTNQRSRKQYVTTHPLPTEQPFGAPAQRPQQSVSELIMEALADEPISSRQADQMADALAQFCQLTYQWLFIREHPSEAEK
jgi:hypothetical protein